MKIEGREDMARRLAAIDAGGPRSDRDTIAFALRKRDEAVATALEEDAKQADQGEAHGKATKNEHLRLTCRAEAKAYRALAAALRGAS